ncbi:MAG: restriction endonuclease subunit S [Planctomycetia bacterium]
MLISSVGARSGIPYLVTKKDGRFYFKDGNLIWIKSFSENLDSTFLLYWLKSNIGQESLASIMIGSAQPALTIDGISNLFIEIPDVKIQKRIANVLSCLDAKIENLRRQNETLEKIAQTLFKHWFIDFEFPFDFAQGQPHADGKPYKSSGGVMVPSELGDIPEGWTIKSLDEIANFLNGLALQKYPPESANEFLPVIKIRELRAGITDSTDKASVNIPKKYIIDNGDIIFSWSGSLDVVIWNFGKGALNQHLFKVDSDNYPKWFYYYWTLNHLQHFQHIAKGKATTMGHIQRKHLTDALCSVPNSIFLEKSDKLFSPLLQKINNNAIQIQTLTKTRDSLLPKLMSGQIRAEE